MAFNSSSPGIMPFLTKPVDAGMVATVAVTGAGGASGGGVEAVWVELLFFVPWHDIRTITAAEILKVVLVMIFIFQIYTIL